MSSRPDKARCDHADLVALRALRILPSSEVAAVEAHIAACSECRRELEALRSVIDSFASWPTDVLRPSESLWERLARRVSAEAGTESAVSAAEPGPQPRLEPSEPDWEEAAPGIFCKLLATDAERDRVSMLVRLAPGIEYPPHTHAGVEELHLLHGELWINDEKFRPGDYRRAEPGSVDHRVWSETGCTCVLVTSALDALL